MIVVADTSPLNYLLLIKQVHILPPLYGLIVIPSAVLEEMLHPSAPLLVRSWAEKLPQWVQIRTTAPNPLFFDSALGIGERQAIALAQQEEGSLLLIDDSLGRVQARQLSIDIIGTLGILKEAHNQGLLDLDDAIKRLKATNFQVSDAIMRSMFGSSQ